jgi:hypothetical protein
MTADIFLQNSKNSESTVRKGTIPCRCYSTCTKVFSVDAATGDWQCN